MWRIPNLNVACGSTHLAVSPAACAAYELSHLLALAGRVLALDLTSSDTPYHDDAGLSMALQHRRAAASASTARWTLIQWPAVPSNSNLAGCHAPAPNNMKPIIEIGASGLGETNAVEVNRSGGQPARCLSGMPRQAGRSRCNAVSFPTTTTTSSLAVWQAMRHMSMHA